MSNNYFRLFRLALLVNLFGLFAGCGGASSPDTDNIPAVEHFNLQRYMGKWYEIARLPNRFERNVADAQADYSLQADGTVKVINQGIKNHINVSVSGIAKTTGISGLGELEVSFFPPFYSLYKIIYLNSDYTLAIVTSSTMDHLWILSRKPIISRQELAQCLELLKKWGFAIKLLQYPSGMVESLAAAP